jgi:Co/Zn/Cd efflux system component
MVSQMTDPRPDEAPQPDITQGKKQARVLKTIADRFKRLRLPFITNSRADKAPQTEAERSKRQARVLKTVAIIKSVMFVAEAILSFVAHSSSLRADALDSGTDAGGTAASALVHKHSQRRQALVALTKAGVMAAGACFVTGVAILTLINPVSLPAITLMLIAGGAAFVCNATCATLLLPHRNDNINMKSSWKSIRLDSPSNASVLLAAGISLLAKSAIPDPVIGMLLSAWCMKSAWDIARESIEILWAPENAKQKKPGKLTPPRKAETKLKLGLKKALCIVFNLKTTDTEKNPVVSTPEKPRYEDLPNPNLRERTDARAGTSAAAPSAPAA